MSGRTVRRFACTAAISTATARSAPAARSGCSATPTWSIARSAGNKAGENGGALEAYRPTGGLDHLFKLNVNMTNCTFGSNDATQGYYGQRRRRPLRRVQCHADRLLLPEQPAKSGGGLFATSGTLKLNGGSISGNVSTGRSGANTNPG